jgi:hypothetical protein
MRQLRTLQSGLTRDSCLWLLRDITKYNHRDIMAGKVDSGAKHSSSDVSDRVYLNIEQIKEFSVEHRMGIENLDGMLKLYEGRVWLGTDNFKRQKLLIELQCPNENKVIPYSIDGCIVASLADQADPLYVLHARFRGGVQHTSQEGHYRHNTLTWNDKNLPLPKKN